MLGNEAAPWRETVMTVDKMRREADKRNESMEGGGAWRALDFVIYIFFVIILILSVRSVLFDTVRVDGTSMLDSLSDNDVMLVDRMAYAFKSPKRGDVVVCYYPDAYYEEQGLSYDSRVKRVIAVAGDTIESIGNEVYVNGDRIDEPYLTPDRIGGDDIPLQTIPVGCVYVLGDNRCVSRDSRYEDVGPIPLSRIVGKSRIVLYPFYKLRLI